jgi:hypothetical protein
MPTPPVIADLVARFEQQGDAYESGQYDKLVYELYELTPDEIKIVEGATA